jgi:hypothetical protein
MTPTYLSTQKICSNKEHSMTVNTQWLNKDPDTGQLSRRAPALEGGEQPFFSANAAGIPADVFSVGAACSAFSSGLARIEDVADVLTEVQVDEIVRLYDVFMEETGLVEYKRKAKGLQLENGRLRAKIKRLEAADE